MSAAAAIDDIRARLERVLAPTALEVLDEGHLHIGHAAEGTGHFRIRIASAALAGKTRVQQHQVIYAALGELMGNGIHALAIEVLDA